MRQVIEDVSHNHTKDIILALQETWRYEIPSSFKKQYQDRYYFLHESAMKKNKSKRKGRPHGGIAFIISRSVAFQIKYSNCRCLSILLSAHKILINNVYLPAQDSRILVEEQIEKLMEALGHFEAAHEGTNETVDCITLGDFNSSPYDNNERSRLIKSALENQSYDTQTDTRFLAPSEYTHEKGRLIDRIVATSSISNRISAVSIPHTYYESDHFAIVAEMNVRNELADQEPEKKPSFCWSKASEKAIFSYSKLLQKECTKLMKKFDKNEINGAELYSEIVENMHKAAITCIPKYSSTEKKRHDIPMWRQRMMSFKTDVEYWTQLQFLHGGPNNCPPIIKQQLRLSKSRYRHQIRQLRREIEVKLAEKTTLRNCHKQLFKKTKSPAPAMIEGHSRPAQPVMWRSHFHEVFNAEEAPYDGDLLEDIHAKITHADIRNFEYIKLAEMNDILPSINSDKSYQRHHHWEKLHSENHAAKLCLLRVFNYWIKNVLDRSPTVDWDFFLTDLNLIPKSGKKDLSLKNSWRPISIGSSENWILEKIILNRLSSFIHTKDCQFGYKPNHSTAHAIELVRELERNYDAHVCLLDASSAFDKLSWYRIKDQLIKRKLPYTLITIVMSQLMSTKIRICGTEVLYPRLGVKQGGVLSGILFSCCYDDLVEDLEKTGIGVLLKTLSKYMLLCVIVYADDVILIASSPYGLKKLIEKTLLFASRYNDITFNSSKSWIMRFGNHNNPPVPMCNIETSECQLYLGVEIGRQAEQQKRAAGKLYCNANKLFLQNKHLNKCSNEVKNVCINSYGNVYSLENELQMSSKLRQAHRYMTMSVHKNWRQFADLDGPNIRSRLLYTIFNLDSIEVLHRRRRNNFLIQAARHKNHLISGVIGILPRITV